MNYGGIQRKYKISFEHKNEVQYSGQNSIQFTVSNYSNLQFL